MFNLIKVRKWSWLFSWAWCLPMIPSCTSQKYDPTLPKSTELGSARGYKFARVITHDHSPYSYDACDKNGLPDGKPDATCLAHFRESLCKNHVDMVFMSDHPDNMANYEISDLLLKDPADTILEKDGKPYANQMTVCEDGFQTYLMTGFEGQLLGLGMTQHLETDISKRSALYQEQTVELKDRLKSEAEAFVVVPHTESRDVSLIQALKPDAIEVYNIHANLDPKIRQKYFHVPPFQHLPGVITYLIDPYQELNPDFSFLGFFKVFPIYFEKWNELISLDVRTPGIAGTDAHENTFPQKVQDGERFDSHRRLTRFVSNHVLVESIEIENVKEALQAGRSYIVVEGFGTPIGLDYSAELGTAVSNMGETVTLGGKSATLHVKMPTLYSGSPKGSESPSIRIELRQVLTEKQDQVVAGSTHGDLTYTTEKPGAYRFYVYITPKHLKEFLGPLSEWTQSEFLWVISNHIYLDA
jgi:hypothetical protein